MVVSSKCYYLLYILRCIIFVFTESVVEQFLQHFTVLGVPLGQGVNNTVPTGTRAPPRTIRGARRPVLKIPQLILEQLFPNFFKSLLIINVRNH